MIWLVLYLVWFLGMCVTGYLLDVHAWNDGYCRENGRAWRIRDRDSQGGWLLKAGDRYTWLNGWVHPREQE